MKKTLNNLQMLTKTSCVCAIDSSSSSSHFIMLYGKFLLVADLLNAHDCSLHLLSLITHLQLLFSTTDGHFFLEIYENVIAI